MRNRNLMIGMRRWVTRYAASSYIAGLEARDAIRVGRRIAKSGFRSTIGPWDGPHDAPESVAASYKEAIDSLIDEEFDCYLSVKVPSLAYDFTRLNSLVTIARDHSIRIHFDSLAPDTATPCMNLFHEMAEVYQNISYTLPSRWRRSVADAERIIDLGVPVRLIKGQWADPAEPNIDARASFLSLVDVLAGRASCVAIATHDTQLAREALTRLKGKGTVCELEQLYGLPMRDGVAKSLGIPLRIYIPYGHAYLAYSLSAIRKRPIIVAWLFRDLLTGIMKSRIGS